MISGVVSEVVLICWKLEAQWDLIGLLLWALNPFKMILFWGLKKFPLRLEIPTLKDHLSFDLENVKELEESEEVVVKIEVVLKCWNLKEQRDFL